VILLTKEKNIVNQNTRITMTEEKKGSTCVHD